MHGIDCFMQFFRSLPRIQSRPGSNRVLSAAISISPGVRDYCRARTAQALAIKPRRGPGSSPSLSCPHIGQARHATRGWSAQRRNHVASLLRPWGLRRGSPFAKGPAPLGASRRRFLASGPRFLVCVSPPWRSLPRRLIAWTRLGTATSDGAAKPATKPATSYAVGDMRLAFKTK
jgi:hypothetical protein